MGRGDWGTPISGEVIPVWHGDSQLPDVDLVVLPGGFSYGDYLRCGAISARSPIMQAIIEHANKGRYIIGICNGFQVLTESGLLPGALMRNEQLHFICRPVHLTVESANTPFTRDVKAGDVIQLPVAHHDGNYRIDEDGLKALQDKQQIVFRYANATGQVTKDSNINGSVHNIAGICNDSGTILGMMPHPERACDPLTGGTDGRALFTGLAQSLATPSVA
jgi:phosphoribosylformylglycinamidine synthase